MPTVADSVRLALPVEAAPIAALQRRAWQERTGSDDPLAEVFRSLLDGVDLETMVQSWHHAVVAAPEARSRVLVAVGAADGVVGFATVCADDDPDADPGRDGSVAELVVDPAARGAGHGSRLLNAAVDTLRADGFSRATWWAETGDDLVLGFLRRAGWAPDGAFREIGTEDEAGQPSIRVRQVRLHTDISPAA